ncbi:MAG: glucose-1-phosphate adenylyltransferase [Eubacterium sp.]
MKRKKCVAMLLAGGQGSRLMPLTEDIAKPAVPFGARYRIIDFPLSNCLNSGIDTVGVLTQYRPMELNDYLGMGEPWDLNRRFGGLHTLPPYQTGERSDWFKGTANAIYQHIAFIKRYDPEYVLILSGDHIYKMNYDLMLQEHIKNHADCTIAVIDVDPKEASRFGIMNTDDRGRILEFEEKPAHPKSMQASMGVYIFSTDVLIKYLQEDEADPDSSNDFGKDIIPKMLNENRRMFAYLYKGYWRDVGTLASYWSANMDAISMDPAEDERLVLNDPGWRIYYRHLLNEPQFLGDTADVTNSIMGSGCEINGKVTHSVLFDNVDVEEGAEIKDSVILSGAKIHAGAKVEYSIIAGDVTISKNCCVGGPQTDGNLTVVARDITVPEGTSVQPGEIVTADKMNNK